MFVAADGSGEADAADADEHVGRAGAASASSATWSGGSGRPAAASTGSWSPTSIRRPARFSPPTPTTPSSPGALSFFRATEAPESYTADRIEFVGRNRSLTAPAALFRERLEGRSGAGLDPCAALQVAVELEPGESRRVGVRAGAGARPRGTGARSPSTTAGSRRSSRRSTRSSGRGTTASGRSRCARPTIRSICIVNRWLLYQTLELPDLGAQRSVSAGRRLRVPRSAAGRPGAAVRAARTGPRPSARGGVAAVRRGRRAALVASAERPRHPDALLRRPVVAAVLRRALRRVDRGRCRCSTRWCRSSRRRCSSPHQDEAYRAAGGLDAIGAALRARRARDRARDEIRRTRPAAHRVGRLERRHEPRGPPEGAARACGWAGSSSPC